jgi:hypothetical protein
MRLKALGSIASVFLSPDSKAPLGGAPPTRSSILSPCAVSMDTSRFPRRTRVLATRFPAALQKRTVRCPLDGVVANPLFVVQDTSGSSTLHPRNNRLEKRVDTRHGARCKQHAVKL